MVQLLHGLDTRFFFKGWKQAVKGVISYFTEKQLKRNANKINVFFHTGNTSFETIYSKR